MEDRTGGRTVVPRRLRDRAKRPSLQVTDIKEHNNKYDATRIARRGRQVSVFTHYGRTDDLETNPNPGPKQCRYSIRDAEAEACYQSIYREKNVAEKGYKEVALASSKIGRKKPAAPVPATWIRRRWSESPRPTTPPREVSAAAGRDSGSWSATFTTKPRTP